MWEVSMAPVLNLYSEQMAHNWRKGSSVKHRCGDQVRADKREISKQERAGNIVHWWNTCLEVLSFSLSQHYHKTTKQKITYTFTNPTYQEGTWADMVTADIDHCRGITTQTSVKSGSKVYGALILQLTILGGFHFPQTSPKQADRSKVAAVTE